MSALPLAVIPLLNAAADLAGVERALVRAVCWVESRGDVNVPDSRTGARGLMQLMPSNWNNIDPSDPKQNAERGARLLGAWLRKYGGDVELALAAYNWGPGNLAKNGGVIPDRVRAHYIQPVLARLDIERQSKGEPPPLPRLPATEPALSSQSERSRCPCCGQAIVRAGGKST